MLKIPFGLGYRSGELTPATRTSIFGSNFDASNSSVLLLKVVTDINFCLALSFWQSMHNSKLMDFDNDNDSARKIGFLFLMLNYRTDYSLSMSFVLFVA